jgi:two-component system CheB/CheR fusion protein
MKNIYRIIYWLAGAAIVIAVMVTAVSIWTFSQSEQAAKARDHTRLVISGANGLLSELLDAETGQRGYALTGHETFLVPYLSVRDKVSGRLKELRQITSIDAAQKSLDALAPLIVAKMAEMARVIELRRNNDQLAVVAAVSSGEGKRLMDAIRVEMRSFIIIEENQLVLHDAELQGNMRSLFAVIIFASFFMMLLALAFAYFISREARQLRSNLDKRSEEAGREYAESIIDTVREPLIALDQDLRVVTVSRSFYDVFKVNPKETVGQLIYDLGNKQWDIPKLRELLEKILPEKSTFDNYEVEHEFATIGKRIMLLNARQIQRVLGKEKIILLAIEDITERKAIEAGLEKTRQELAVIKKTADEASEFAESVINTVREPLISLDHDLRVVTVSRSFYDVFKVNPKETVGQLIYDLGNKQWDIPKLRELLEKILPEKSTFDNYEVEHNFATIGRRVMLLNARQIERGAGKKGIILLAIEDITERRETENGLKKAHEEMTALAEELKRAARVKSEFLANMSHELRTPLNSIIGFSEVLFDGTFGPLNEKQKRYAGNVLTSGKHLLLLIDQILDMAKVEAGKMTLSLSNLPMKSLLNDLARLVADMVDKKKLAISLEIAEDLPNIEGDELKVKEIIYNLLSNAIKFTPEGGQIGLRAKPAGSGIEVVVWDTGLGIAPENMEKIFEGFFRVDTPYSRVTEGTGLGLPLSKKLVELHGGSFFVKSEGLDKGTEVRFTLPLIPGQAA